MAKKSNKKKSGGKKKANQQQQKRPQAVAVEDASVDEGVNTDVVTEVIDASLDDVADSAVSSSGTDELLRAEGSDKPVAEGSTDRDGQKESPTEAQRKQTNSNGIDESERPIAVETVNIMVSEQQSGFEDEMEHVEGLHSDVNGASGVTIPEATVDSADTVGDAPTSFVTSEDSLSAAAVGTLISANAEVHHSPIDGKPESKAHDPIQQEQEICANIENQDVELATTNLDNVPDPLTGGHVAQPHMVTHLHEHIEEPIGEVNGDDNASLSNQDAKPQTVFHENDVNISCTNQLEPIKGDNTSLNASAFGHHGHVSEGQIFKKPTDHSEDNLRHFKDTASALPITESDEQFNTETQLEELTVDVRESSNNDYCEIVNDDSSLQFAQVDYSKNIADSGAQDNFDQSKKATPVFNEGSFNVEEKSLGEGADAQISTKNPIEDFEPLSMKSSIEELQRKNNGQEEEEEEKEKEEAEEQQQQQQQQGAQGESNELKENFLEDRAIKENDIFHQSNDDTTNGQELLNSEHSTEENSCTVDPSGIAASSALQPQQNYLSQDASVSHTNSSEVNAISTGYVTTEKIHQGNDSNDFWNYNPDTEEGNDLPWNNRNDEIMPWDINREGQRSNKVDNLDSLDINESLLPDIEDDSFFSHLNNETQNAKTTQPANPKENTDAKFAFMEEDDIMLDDIMDDDLLDDEDDNAGELSFDYSSNKSADNTIVYNPSSPLANQHPQMRASSVYQPRRSTSTFNQNDDSLPCGIKSVLSATKISTFNSAASVLHQKLEEEKKKSDAYDFPADLISKHKKKTPQATHNVYTNLEDKISHHEQTLDLKAPPKIGQGNHFPPQSPSLAPISTSSQMNSRSSSITKKDSFFAEIPVPVNKTNISTPVHLKNPYAAIENENNLGKLPMPSNVPTSIKRKNPYAPPSISTISSPSLQQTNSSSSQIAKNPYSIPEIPLAEQKHTMTPPVSGVTRLQPAHPSSRQTQRSASGSKNTNPYAPTEVGGHARTTSMDPTPVDINPNLVAIPALTPLAPTSPMSNFSQPMPSQYSQATNNYMPQIHTSQLSSPVNQFAPSIAGTINQGFAFPSGPNKYTPGNNVQSAPHANITGLRRSTKVGRQSISSINEVYGSNIVTSSATSTAYRKKSVLPPGLQSKGRNLSANNVSIAPAPVVINPENLNRRQWPLFAFSTEKFLSMIPSSNGYGVDNCSFRIENLKSIMTDNDCTSTFPGPLSKSKTKRKELIKWLEFKIASIRSHNGSDGISTGPEELMWSILKFMAFHINNNDDFANNKEYQNVILHVLNPNLSEFNDQGNVFDIVSIRNTIMSINPTTEPNAHRVDSQTLSIVHTLLEKGDKASALSLVLSKGDWSMALLVANLMGPLAFNQILNLYTTINYGDNNLSSDLNFFLQANALEGLSSDSLIGKESWIAEHYKTIIPFILKNTSKSTVTLYQIGELLMKSGHRIYGKISILLSGEPLVPTCNEMLPTSIDDMIADEIYEYILLSSGNMPSQFAHGLPHMLPVKIRHAGYLVDFGVLAEAKKYCDATQGEIYSRQLYVETSTKIAQNNLSESLSQVNSNWLGGKISRPQLDKVWTTLDKSFNKFVSGEENVEKKRVEDGMFSKFTSPSVSRIGSQLDLTQSNVAIHPTLTTVTSLPSIPNVYGNQAKASVSANSTPKRLGPTVGHFANVVNPPIANNLSHIISASIVPPARANTGGPYAPKAASSVTDLKVNKYAPAPITNHQKYNIENSNAATNTIFTPPVSNIGFSHDYPGSLKNDKYSPRVINPTLPETNESASFAAAGIQESKITSNFTSVMKTLPDEKRVSLTTDAQNLSEGKSYAPPIQPYEPKATSITKSPEIVASNDQVVDSKQAAKVHELSQLYSNQTSSNPPHTLSPSDAFVNEKEESNVDIHDKNQLVPDTKELNTEQEKSFEDSYDEDLDETNNYPEKYENKSGGFNEEGVDDGLIAISQQPEQETYLHTSVAKPEEKTPGDNNTAQQPTQPMNNGSQYVVEDVQKNQNIVKQPDKKESEVNASDTTEPTNSATSLQQLQMPKAKHPVNRYAPGGGRPARKSTNPYANPNAMKNNAKKNESVYAPKGSSEKPTDNENYDPLAAMGITGNVSSMDMFTVGGYHIPPPSETVDETSKSTDEISKPEEKIQIEQSKVIEDPVKQGLDNVPIPMMHMPSTNASHLTNMFNPPSAPTSVAFEEQKTSPIYTITEQKKFYAEDTGEFYDDVIDDDDDDDDDALNGTARKAEQERLLEEERQRKKKEENELRKRKEEEETKKKELAKERSGSWFGSFFGGNTAKDQKKVYKAKLGEENSFYYDETLKRWINKKASKEEQLESSKPPPPPPGKQTTSTPSINSSMAPTPPPGASSISLSHNPLAGGSLSSAPNKLNNSSKSDSIDDLLNRPSATTRKGKRGPRRGYVDVMAQQ